jgi:hypothetical protein
MADSRGSYTVILKVVDLATSKFDALNKKLAALNAPFDKLNRSFDRFSKLSGLNRVGQVFGALERTIGGALKTAISFVPVLGSLAGAGILAGIYRLVESTADWATHLTITSRALGMTTSQLGLLESAAKLAGGSAQSLDAGLTSMQRLMDMARNAMPGGEDIYLVFQKIGLGAAGLKKNAADAIPAIADYYKTLDAQNRRALRDVLHLDDSWDLLLRNGSAGYKKLTEAAKALHPQSDKQIEDARKTALAFAELNERMLNLSRTLVVALGPSIQKGLSEFGNFIEKHQNDILKFFEDLPKNIDLAIQKITDLIAKINAVVEAFGGWTTIAEVVIGAKLVGALVQVGSLLGGLPLLLNPFSLAVEALVATVWGLPRALNAAMDAINRQLPQWMQDEIAARHGHGGRGSPSSSGHGHAADPKSVEQQQRDKEIADKKAEADKEIADKKAAADKENAEGIGKTITDWFDEHFGSGFGPGATGHGFGGKSDDYKPITAADKVANQKIIYETLKSKGWSDEAIAGAFENGHLESGFNPYASQGGGAHLGTFQWDRQRQADFARLNGHAVNDKSVPMAQLVKEQAEFADWEVKNQARFAKLREAMKNNPHGDFGQLFNEIFEVSGEQRGDSLSRKYLEMIRQGYYGQQTPPTGNQLPPPAPFKTSMGATNGDWQMHLHINDPKGYVNSHGLVGRGFGKPLVTSTNTQYGYA